VVATRTACLLVRVARSRGAPTPDRESPARSRFAFVLFLFIACTKRQTHTSFPHVFMLLRGHTLRGLSVIIFFIFQLRCVLWCNVRLFNGGCGHIRPSGHA
jgi:hypothetical protein